MRKKKDAVVEVGPELIRHRIITSDDHSFVTNFGIRIEAGILMLMNEREDGKVVIEQAYSPLGWKEVVRES